MISDSANYFVLEKMEEEYEYDCSVEEWAEEERNAFLGKLSFFFLGHRHCRSPAVL